MSDLIERQKAIDAVERNACNTQRAIDAVKALPSAQPERKKGKWIDGRCSICGCDIPAYIIDWKWQKDMDANYCPVCGADMREDKHDQSK